MFRHTVCSGSVDIEAPVRRYGILADVDVREWFHHARDTSLRSAHPLICTSLGPFGSSSPNDSGCRPSAPAWGMTMGARWLLKTRREQRLELLSDTRCRYMTTDAFTGVLTPLVVLLFGGLIRRGFNAMALALKERAEEGIHS